MLLSDIDIGSPSEALGTECTDRTDTAAISSGTWISVGVYFVRNHVFGKHTGHSHGICYGGQMICTSSLTKKGILKLSLHQVLRLKIFEVNIWHR